MSTPDLPPDTPAHPVSRRAAWTLVIIMTALLALALIGVVWGMVRQGRILLEGRARQTPPPAAAAPNALILPPGAKIISSTTEAGRLVLRIQTAQGEELRIIDLATGKAVQTIKTAK